MRTLLILGLLVGLPVSADEVYTGRELLDACRSPAAADDERSCQRWIDWGFSSPYFCIPAGTADEEVSRVLVAWLEAHPGKLHMPGGALVQNAFFDAWPCRKTTRKTTAEPVCGVAAAFCGAHVQ